MTSDKSEKAKYATCSEVGVAVAKIILKRRPGELLYSEVDVPLRSCR